MTLSYFDTKRGYRLGYVHSAPTGKGAHLPVVMFLGGFKSDMAGTKALYLEEQCQKRGQEFVRFDYSGHGESDGAFADGTVGSWKLDAIDILENIVKRDVILVGSSMGGWIALRLLIERPEQIKGVVGIAAAPDFTRDIAEKMSAEEHAMMERLGRLEIPNDYSDEPYIFTRALLEDGEEQSLLDKMHEIQVPLTLIQGKRDADVPWEKAEKIKEMFKGPDTNIIFVDDGDHRLSRDQDLEMMDRAVQKMRD